MQQALSHSDSPPLYRPYLLAAGVFADEIRSRAHSRKHFPRAGSSYLVCTACSMSVACDHAVFVLETLNFFSVWCMLFDVNCILCESAFLR
eukprot:749933-Hanusia_phi.AAC.5